MKMTQFSSIREFGEYLLLTFGIRRAILYSIIVLSIIPGAFLSKLPSNYIDIYAIIFTSLTFALVFPIVSIFSLPMRAIFSQVKKDYKTEEYNNPAIQNLKNKMHVQNVKTYLIDNSDIVAYTNPFTKKVYVQKECFENLPICEVYGIFGHEFGHIKTFHKFIAEALIVMSIAFVASNILSFFTVPIIYLTFEVAFLILAISFILWRNEFRADWEGAKGVGIENMIAVFELFQAMFKKDEGSETHPSLKSRINRLMAILE